MTAPKITLVKTTAITPSGRHQLAINITNSEYMPKELFVLMKDSSSRENDKYSRVCSIFDIKYLITDRTSAGTIYRSNSMVFETDNIVELQTAITNIIEDLNEIVLYYKTKNIELVASEEILTLTGE